MGPKAVAFSEALNEALQYLAYSMFSPLHLLVENSQLYPVKEKELG